MAITYHKADDAAHDLGRDVLKRHEPDLHREGVTFDLTFAHGPDGEPVLKHGGYPAAGKIKINSTLDRAKGLPDCSVILDAACWLASSRRKQESLLFHEFHHLQLVYTKATKKRPKVEVRRDEHGRPKLKLRLHDYDIGIFSEVIEEYGGECFDYDQLATVEKLVQQTFHWG